MLEGDRLEFLICWTTAAWTSCSPGALESVGKEHSLHFEAHTCTSAPLGGYVGGKLEAPTIETLS